MVVSPKGGKAPLDPISVELFKDDAQSQTFLKEHSKVWETTEPLANYLGKASEFAAIFYVGGHGRMHTPLPSFLPLPNGSKPVVLTSSVVQQRCSISSTMPHPSS